MIRILYVIENIYFGGGERVFAQLINGLDKKTYEIYVACQPGGAFAQRISGSAEIVSFSLRGLRWMSALPRLVKMLRDKRIQIVHSQGARADFFSRIAARLARVPVVISTIAAPVEEYDVGVLKKAFYVILDRLSERRVHKFIVVTDALKEKLLKKHKIPPERIVKISNGIEIDEYYQDYGSSNKIREEFNIGPDTVLVGTVGRLARVKGLTYFIKAIRHIEDTNEMTSNNLKYLIVGEGHLRKELQDLAKELKIDKKVIFTGFRRDIKHILSALDIFILASVREGQPMILLEAMAMSKPIVATDTEGARETLQDGVTGVLVPPRNSSRLAEAIIYLLKNKDRACAMGIAARRRAEKDFSVGRMIKNTTEVYNDLLHEDAIRGKK